MPLAIFARIFRAARNLFVGTVKFVFYFSVIVGVIGLGATVGVVKTFSKQLPEIGYHTYKPNINTKVYDGKGNLLAEFHEVENRREKVPLARIPKTMQDAIISIEDARFFKHYGVDPIRIVAAGLTNLRRASRSQGASTITQQLARNAFLTFEKTYTRKIKEILLSFKIEKKFTKYEILELYLNEIYFGHGAWGLSSAAWIYFGKRPEDLNLAECALLAGLPRSPSDYDPFRHKDKAKQRQVLVLNQMVENRFITDAQAREAKNMPVRLHTGTNESVDRSSYFVEYVRNILIQKFGPKQVYTEGLKVYTTIDPEMQVAAESAFCGAAIFKDKPVSTHPTLQGGLLAIEPTTGYIKAMVGGRDYKQSEFNRAVQARRQPGSSFKPFIYLTALMNGVRPNTIMVDEPIQIVNRFTGKVWEPKNYGNQYVGALTLKEALAKSLNSIAVKLIQQVGPAKVIATANKCGIVSKLGANLALALGAADVTLLEMTTAYSTLANEGIRVEPIPITKVLDANGNTLFQAKYSGEQVIDQQTVYTLIDMMKGTIDHGTGTRAKIDRPCAGKTGTTNDSIDAWFCGYTPSLVCCIYVGNDDRRTLGHSMSGGVVCAPIWKEFMTKALENVPPVDFRQPEGTVRVTICRDSGLLPASTCKNLTTANFQRGMEPEEICDAHDDTQTAENYYESDGDSTLITPRKVDHDAGSRIETTDDLEPDASLDLGDAPAEAAGQENELAPDADAAKEDKHEPRRSRFSNAHDNPDEDLNLD